ncbi:MAG TPA: lysophospholipid acyltransferase family protein [Anaerolineales bacterium]|nr:lysophospholipid acyltransferase family protein [Anaerolineales bacterium]
MLNLFRWLLRAILNLIASIEIHGYENIPESGAFVIATNHLGMLDSAMLYYALNRWDVFIPVAEKWEEIWIFRFLSRYIKLIFIDRFNPDLKALRKIIKLMEAGNILVIAPEGTRSRSATMAEGKPGVSYLASKLNRPIVPVGLAGTEDQVILDNLKHFRRSRIVVSAGKPFTLPPLPTKDRDASLKRDTDEIMCRIASLIPPKYRGVYAEHPRLKELLAATSA